MRVADYMEFVRHVSDEEISEHESEVDVLERCERKLDKSKRPRRSKLRSKRKRRHISSSSEEAEEDDDDMEVGSVTNSDDETFEPGDRDIDGPPKKRVAIGDRLREIVFGKAVEEDASAGKVVVPHERGWWVDRIRDVNEQVLGGHPPIMYQDGAVERIQSSLLNRAVKVHDTDKPGVFLFVGSSGHGKSALSARVCQTLFSKEVLGYDAFIRVDLAKYRDQLDSARLWGSAPGTVGFEQRGLLVSFLAGLPKRDDFYDGIVVFEEADKADPSIFVQIMEFLDRGLVTDNKGVDHVRPNLLIVLTANTASEVIHDFVEKDPDARDDKVALNALQEQVKEVVTETLCDGASSVSGRLGEPVVFLDFTKAQCAMLIRAIVLAQGAKMAEGVTGRDGDLFAVSQEHAERIAQVYYNPKLGMRSMQVFVELVRTAFRDFILSEDSRSVKQLVPHLAGDTPRVNARVELVAE